MATLVSSNRRLELAYTYLPTYDADFLLRTYEELRADEVANHATMSLLSILFEALDWADKGIIQDTAPR